MEKRNSLPEHGQPMEQTGDRHSLSITTSASLLANRFDVRSELHGQVSLAAVNQILCNSLGYERLQKSKDSFIGCFETVNICA